MNLSAVVTEIDGKLLKDGEFESMNYCTSDRQEKFLTFIEKEKFIAKMNPNVSCVICKEELVDKLPDSIEGIFISKEPKYTFHRIYHERSNKIPKKHIPTKIGENCNISPLAYLSSENVVIGNNVVIEPFAYIGENVTIKDNCIIHAHAVIGGRSFSPARGNKREICGLDDHGQTVLERNVEIYSFTYIAQGIWEDDVTLIGENTVIDTECHIAHGCRIGKSVLIASNAVIGGNVRIGDATWIGLNATISNRISIGKKVRINLGAVVVKDVKDYELVYPKPSKAMGYACECGEHLEKADNGYHCATCGREYSLDKINGRIMR